MSNTFKSKANYGRFHKEKLALTGELKELAELMDKNNTGARHGNNRHWLAQAKVKARRSERAKNRQHAYQLLLEV